MNEILRPLAHDLGFDQYGQLIVRWNDNGSTCSTICKDVRGITCSLCGKGWDVTAESFRNQYLCRTTEEWCHYTCFVGHLGMAEAEMWYSLLCYPKKKETFIPFDWNKIPNEYGGDFKTPWYLVKFDGYFPKLKLGRRKHVYSMSEKGQR